MISLATNMVSLQTARYTYTTNQRIPVCKDHNPRSTVPTKRGTLSTPTPPPLLFHMQRKPLEPIFHNIHHHVTTKEKMKQPQPFKELSAGSVVDSATTFVEALLPTYVAKPNFL